MNGTIKRVLVVLAAVLMLGGLSAAPTQAASVAATPPGTCNQLQYNIYGWDYNSCLGDGVWMHGVGYPLETCRNMPAGWGNRINAIETNNANRVYLYTGYNCAGARLIIPSNWSADLPCPDAANCWKNNVESYVIKSFA